MIGCVADAARLGNEERLRLSSGIVLGELSLSDGVRADSLAALYYS
jgi:hypothetical protein